MNPSMRLRLSAAMFLQYFALGAWVVPTGTFLLDALHWTGPQVGSLYNTVAIGAVLSPLLVGVLADRYFAGQRVFAVLQLAAAGVMFAVARFAGSAQASADPNGPAAVGAIWWLFLAHSLAFLPTVTLGNVIVLRAIGDPKHFGGVRVFGTVGWVAAGLTVGLCLRPLSPDMLDLSAAASLAAGLLGFALPDTPPLNQGRTWQELVGLPALAMLARPAYAVFFACLFLTTVLNAFYSTFGNPYLKSLLGDRAVAVQTLAQSVELGLMVALPWGLSRLGMRGLMLVGLLAWVVRYGIFAGLNAPLVVAVGLPLHGVSFVCFNIVASLYVDREAPRHLRASAQGLNMLVTMGAGILLGNWFAGRAVAENTAGGVTDWSRFWLWPTAVAAATLAVFAAGFRERVGAPTVAEEYGDAREPREAGVEGG